jgi:hypothetical protein
MKGSNLLEIGPTIGGLRPIEADLDVRIVAERLVLGMAAPTELVPLRGRIGLPLDPAL